MASQGVEPGSEGRLLDAVHPLIEPSLDPLRLEAVTVADPGLVIPQIQRPSFFSGLALVLSD